MANKEVNVAQLIEMIESGDTFLLVDVRSADDYERGHIESALSLPANAFQPELIPAWVNEDTPIVAYCYQGVVSVSAAQYLQSIGYKNASSLTGGYDAWRRA